MGASALRPQCYTWYGDNEAATRAVLRGHSASYMGDVILTKWIVSGTSPARVGGIPTACNIVDPLTRGERRLKPFCFHHHFVRFSFLSKF